MKMKEWTCEKYCNFQK